LPETTNLAASLLFSVPSSTEAAKRIWEVLDFRILRDKVAGEDDGADEDEATL
jgi:hypothetical protein